MTREITGNNSNGNYLIITDSGIKRIESLADKFWNGNRLADDEVLLLPLFIMYEHSLEKKYSDQLLEEIIIEIKKRFPNGYDDPDRYLKLGYIEWCNDNDE